MRGLFEYDGNRRSRRVRDRKGGTLRRKL